MSFIYSILFLFIFTLAECKSPSLEDLKLTTLYNSLDPYSISELFAFYELYPQSSQGERALKRVWELFNLHKQEKYSLIDGFFLPKLDIGALISLVNKQPYEAPTSLSYEQLFVIEKLSSHLYNRTLKGYYAKTKEELFDLPTSEIDIARALLIYQYEDSKNPLLDIRRYEATLDLMTLQILARLSPSASPIEKIHAINDFIFHQMQFRFPPHSLMAKDVDVYTFLPSVIDSRRGVCLGVSILYLSLAQRMNLPLEIITPPGHIYIRYRKDDILINIETTARGIHMPSEVYLGINTHSLSLRTMKEVVGMAFVNQASVLWRKKDYNAAADLYLKALPFMPKDPLLKMFLGIQYILLDKQAEGKSLLKEIYGITFDDSVYKETLPEDILNYKISKEALEAVFMHVDESRESIIEKQRLVQAVIKQFPKFRSALMQLATSWLQLGRGKEALEVLQQYFALDPADPTVNYYLSILSLERLSYKEAWSFFLSTKHILDEKNHHPKSLQSLEFQLRHTDPEVIHKDCKLF